MLVVFKIHFQIADKFVRKCLFYALNQMPMDPLSTIKWTQTKVLEANK